MQVKVAILCDNLAGPVSFRAEHGLSILIEVDGRSFLWDCGQSGLAVHNALLLGLDLRRLEGVGISHGHFDHAGGLLDVLRAAGRKRLFMHPGALEPKYFVAESTHRFIGIPFNRDQMESVGESLELNSGPVEVLPGVRMTGEVARTTDFEGHEANLFRRVDGSLVPDPFIDDQSLVVDTPEGAVVLTGCAHSGLVNILRQVLKSTARIRAVIGGTHLGMGASADRVGATLDFLEEILPDKIVPCHCTGLAVTARMMQRFKDRVIPGQAGLVLCL